MCSVGLGGGVVSRDYSPGYHLPCSALGLRPHGWRAVEALARAGRSVDLGAWIGTGVLTGDGATTVRPRPREGDTVL